MIEKRINYHDTDAIGIVYHGAYLNFLEESRAEFFNSKNIPVEDMHEHGRYYGEPVGDAVEDACYAGSESHPGSRFNSSQEFARYYSESAHRFGEMWICPESLDKNPYSHIDGDDQVGGDGSVSCWVVVTYWEHVFSIPAAEPTRISYHVRAAKSKDTSCVDSIRILCDCSPMFHHGIRWHVLLLPVVFLVAILYGLTGRGEEPAGLWTEQFGLLIEADVGVGHVGHR